MDAQFLPHMDYEYILGEEKESFQQMGYYQGFDVTDMIYEMTWEPILCCVCVLPVVLLCKTCFFSRIWI